MHCRPDQEGQLPRPSAPSFCRFGARLRGRDRTWRRVRYRRLARERRAARNLESEHSEKKGTSKGFPYCRGASPVDLVVEDFAIRAIQIGDVDSKGTTPERLFRRTCLRSSRTMREEWVGELTSKASPMSACLRLPTCNLIKSAESAIVEASRIEMVTQVTQTSASTEDSFPLISAQLLPSSNQESALQAGREKWSHAL